MTTRGDLPDVLDVLSSIRPDLDALERTWPHEQRDAMLDQILLDRSASRRRPLRMTRWMGAGTAAAAVTAAALLLIPGVLNPGRPIQAAPEQTTVPSPPDATPSTQPSATPATNVACAVPSSEIVTRALAAVRDPRSGLDNGYEIGWLSAALSGDVIAIQRPVYAGPTPTGTEIVSVRVIGVGNYDPVTEADAENEAAAIACLDANAAPLPDEPDMSCQPANLDTVTLSQGQEGPPTVAYGSKIVDSAQVDAAGGYLIVAVRLAEPTGPQGSDVAAWIHDPSTGYIAPVSPQWQGGGVQDYKAVMWGPLARAAATDCLK